MSEENVSTKLPATIMDAATGIRPSWVPATVKALDRLVGAAIEIPAAWLNQQRAKIDAKTESYRIVESAVASSATNVICNDPEIAQRATNNLLRKEYRKQCNKENIAAIALTELQSPANNQEYLQDVEVPQPDLPQIDDDWLNVFERYVEDISSEKMQRLWGRTLAGEIRKPGRYSLRTLRFLSEFSQEDARIFSDVANYVFGNISPNALINPDGKDVGKLLSLEANGILQGVTASTLKRGLSFNSSGYTGIHEGNINIVLWGEPGANLSIPCCVLSPLGVELLSLLPERDVKYIAKNVAMAIKSSAITSAKLGIADSDNNIHFFETLWDESTKS